MEPLWPIQSYLELFGPNLVLSGLVWYGLVSYFTYWTHFRLFETTGDILEHLDERFFFLNKNKNLEFFFEEENNFFIVKHFLLTKTFKKNLGKLFFCETNFFCERTYWRRKKLDEKQFLLNKKTKQKFLNFFLRFYGENIFR